MQYIRDLPIFEASIENLKSVFRKVSNSKDVLVVSTFGNEGAGQRQAGIQKQKEVSNFWEITTADCSVDQEQNHFAIDRTGRYTKIWVDENRQKYFLNFKPIIVTIRAAYHSQSQLDIIRMVNKWLYWQDKLSFKLESALGTFHIRIDPDESTSAPQKAMDTAENAKLSVGLTMRTFAGIVKSEYVIKQILFTTKVIDAEPEEVLIS